MVTQTGSITDVVNVADGDPFTPVLHYTQGLTDTVSAHDLLSFVKAISAAIADGIGMNPVNLALVVVTVAETLGLSDAELVNLHSQLTISEKMSFSDALARGLPQSIIDGIGINPVQTVKLLVSIIEQLGLAPALAPVFRYHLSVAEQLALADSLARFIGAALIEGLQVLEVVTASAQMPQHVTEMVDVTESVNPRLLLSVLLDESIEVTDAELVRMIFSDAILEGIEVAAGYFDPSGSITTWAMNTRTAAVTEYTNYAFNSFARLGNKYLGATKDGLYELDGDTDAGASIIADLKSGFAQFAGVHLASFKAAYIAARGGGSFVLRVYTGDGSRYDYAVTADTMKTARIDMGKGIRARYFAFELISAGQDFDLESLEFIPLIAKRRV